MKKRDNKNVIIVGVLILAILLVASYLNQSQNSELRFLPAASFSDATPTGGKGLALLLNRVGYRSKVQDAPLKVMPADARVWLMLGPKNAFTKREARLLLRWVEAGGTLIYCVERDANNAGFLQAMQEESEAKKPPANGIETLTDDLKITKGPLDFKSFGQSSNTELPELPAIAFDAPSNIRTGVKKAAGSPGNFGAARAHVEIAGAPGGELARISVGKGQVWAVPDAWVFTNYGLSQPDNAVLVTNILRTCAPPSGARSAVYFDQRAHDETERPPVADTLINRLKRPPISTALWQLLFAGILLWIFASRRLGAAVPLPTRGPVTRASQFAQAMGALFSNAGRPAAAAEVIGADFRKRLAARLGMSPSENDAVLAARAHELSGVPAEVVDRLLLQTRTPANNDAQALRDAQEMDAVLKRLQGQI